MRRFVFVNLHKNGFLIKPFGDVLLKKVIVTKHQYILRYLLDNGYKVASFVDERGGSRYFRHGAFLKNHSSFQKKMSRLLSDLTFYINRRSIQYKSIEIIKDADEISDQDIIISYSKIEECSLKNQTRGKTAVSMLHFYGDKKTSLKLKNLKPDLIFAESRLDCHSELFKKYYKWYHGRMVMLPFVPEPRFQKRVGFDKRNNKAMAIGTLTRNRDAEFVNLYGTSAFQPQRELILMNQERLLKYVDCLISEREGGNSKKEITGAENWMEAVYKRLFNTLYADKQKEYFSFDMVDKFNEYRMFLCPEDAHENPGIGFVEGMACGCAYIGKTEGVYEDYGMVNGKHYIGYDGSLKDLEEKIAYYQRQEHYEEIRSIAENGYDFVRRHFNEEKAAHDFVSELLEL